MISNSSRDLEAWFRKVNNRDMEMEMQKKDLASFSETMNKGRLQEDCDKMQVNGKGSKRKAWMMEGMVEQEWKIVSVSRLTGGKDRHSKVLTAKGLRDRRVRLSVPTAIQLYDLQDRLGYEQPSKAVGWLINAAKSAIDELPVLDPEMDSAASVDNVARLNSSNCSNVDHSVGSPRESGTAITASAFTGFRVGNDSVKARGRKSQKDINGKLVSITTQKGSDLARTSSSISDGSIKGSAENTSNCSISESTSRIESRLKESELATKKSVSSSKSLPAIQQMNSMQHFLTSGMLKSIFPNTPLPSESKSSKNDNPCGIHTQILSGTSNVQQVWDYNNRLSYTDMLCSHGSHPLQNLSSSSTAPLQKYFPRVPSSSGSQIGRNSCLQSYEMPESSISFIDPKQTRPFGGSAEPQGQGQDNLFSNMVMKRVEQVHQRQQQQEAQMRIKHYASTSIPRFSNDINLLTSSLSAGELHQAISSSITNMPSLSHTNKNVYGEVSANAARDFAPSQDYEARVIPGFHYAGQHKS